MANWEDLINTQWVTEQNLNQAYTYGGFPVKTPVGTSQKFMTRADAQNALFVNVIGGNQNQLVTRSELVAAPQEIAQYINLPEGMMLYTHYTKDYTTSQYRLNVEITDPDGIGFGARTCSTVSDVPFGSGNTSKYSTYVRSDQDRPCMSSVQQHLAGNNTTYMVGCLDIARIMAGYSTGQKVRYKISFTRLQGDIVKPQTNPWICGQGGDLSNQANTPGIPNTVATNITVLFDSDNFTNSITVSGYIRKNDPNKYDLYFTTTTT